MLVSVVGRHVQITGEVKSYAEQKAQKLPRFYDRIQAIEVVVDHESDLSSVEMIVTAAGKQTFVAKEVGPDTLACIDLAVDKLERQLTKHKEKFRNRKHLGRKADPFAPLEEPDDQQADEP